MCRPGHPAQPAPGLAGTRLHTSCKAPPLLSPGSECQVSPISSPSRVRSFIALLCSPLASCRLHLFWATLGLLKSARFHQFQAPRECDLLSTLGPSQAPSFTYCRPLASCRLHLFWVPWQRSRFHLLWASSRVPGFTNCGPLASARFHLLWAPRKLQVSPTLGPSQAAGFTFFGPLGSALGFTYFGPPQECQVSPISGLARVPGFTYFGPLASSKFHLL